MLPGRALKFASRFAEATVLDVHDHPVLQLAALGLALPASDAASTLRDFKNHVAAFDVLIAQTTSFADLAGLPADKTLIIPNGTDPRRFRQVPPPAMPVVGLVSGAAPGRGIELLIASVREVRTELPEVRLRMAISAPSESSRAYLSELLARTVADPWIDVVSLSYDQVPQFLETVSVTAVPHPSGEYMDAIVPVKLFDSMMSGRPLVVTPRTETVRVVNTHQVGEVAPGDSPSDLAGAILRLLNDPDRAARLGRNGREAAASTYAWDVLSKQVTQHLTGR